MNYQIDIYFESAVEGYRLRLDSPMGQATSTFELPFSDVELEEFILNIGSTRKAIQRVGSRQMDVAKDFGQHLFEKLFNEALYARFRSTFDQAQLAGKSVSIRLHLQDTPELAALPWEYLYDVSNDSFLTLSTTTPVTRFVSLPQPVPPLSTTQPLRILGVVSNPMDLPCLDIGAEKQQLADAIKGLAERGMENALEVHWLTRATLRALQRELRKQEYHILHFVGHGFFDAESQEGALIFEDGDGQGQRVSAEVLGALLKDHRTMRLAVLNACEGARSGRFNAFTGVAPSLVRSGLPAVAAMQFNVTDAAAIIFAREFYGALADGYSAENALVEARKAMFISGNEVEWGKPVLFTRVDSGIIFQLHPQVNDKATDVDQLYQRVITLAKYEHWSKAHEAWLALRKQAPNYVDRVDVAELIERHLEVERLYQQIKDLVATRQWEKAHTIWCKLVSIDHTFGDTDGLAAQIRRGMQPVQEMETPQAQPDQLYAEVRKLILQEQRREAEQRLPAMRATAPNLVDVSRYAQQGIAGKKRSTIDRIAQSRSTTAPKQPAPSSRLPKASPMLLSSIGIPIALIIFLTSLFIQRPAQNYVLPSPTETQASSVTDMSTPIHLDSPTAKLTATLRPTNTAISTATSTAVQLSTATPMANWDPNTPNLPTPQPELRVSLSAPQYGDRIVGLYEFAWTSNLFDLPQNGLGEKQAFQLMICKKDTVDEFGHCSTSTQLIDRGLSIDRPTAGIKQQVRLTDVLRNHMKHEPNLSLRWAEPYWFAVVLVDTQGENPKPIRVLSDVIEIVPE